MNKKSYLISGLFFIMITFSAFSQNLYFDIGLGVGSATTELDGQDFSDSMDPSVEEAAVEIGLKLGFGPIARMPLYIVGEISGIGHRFEDEYNYIQFNSYLIGPGIIFYPAPFLQIAASIGYSYVSNQTDLPYALYESTSGTAGNASVAIDLGSRNNGLLIGLKYSVTKNTLETSEAEQQTSLTSIFIKYAYRNKIQPY